MESNQTIKKFINQCYILNEIDDLPLNQCHDNNNNDIDNKLIEQHCNNIIHNAKIYFGGYEHPHIVGSYTSMYSQILAKGYCWMCHSERNVVLSIGTNMEYKNGHVAICVDCLHNIVNEMKIIKKSPIRSSEFARDFEQYTKQTEKDIEILEQYIKKLENKMCKLDRNYRIYYRTIKEKIETYLINNFRTEYDKCEQKDRFFFKDDIDLDIDQMIKDHLKSLDDKIISIEKEITRLNRLIDNPLLFQNN